MTDGLAQKLQEQVKYYRARAAVYDAWADRRGAYDRGSRNDGWFAEKERLTAALRDFHARGDVLEIAGGTGQWTQQLVEQAGSLTVLDAAREALDRNQMRLGTLASDVTYVQTDFFDWDPPQLYDVVFFSYWLSHVPPEYFEEFWGRVAATLKPDGRVFLIDNIATEHADLLDPEVPGDDDVSVMRPGPDGSMYRVWKVLWEPKDLQHALRRLGWTTSIYPTGTYFMWAEGSRSR
jgi:demethylmenaquinone methyltransferase/2-methoxy-6-polyprenyl-1,4-benzoquinol methylase